jgi:hypothetical protein
MSYSATELQTWACCYLARLGKWEAIGRFLACRLDYEEKNDTGFITITAPPNSYESFAEFNSRMAMELWITPDKLDPKVQEYLPEEYRVLRSIYRTFAACVLDPIEGTPTALQVHVKKASAPTELQHQKPVNEQLEQDIIQKIIEKASSCALGWILEGLCKLRLNTKLEIEFIGNHRMARELLEEPETKSTIEDIVRDLLGRNVEVILSFPDTKADLAEPPIKLISDQYVDLNSVVNNQCRQFDKSNPVSIWENLRFRSLTEIRIAQALDKRKVLFLPNCAARLGFSRRQNREADSLVCEKGKWGILEADSPDSHPPARTVEDHERARLFQAHGILLVQLFDGGECFENADGVVDKFLYLLRNQK